MSKFDIFWLDMIWYVNDNVDWIIAIVLSIGFGTLLGIILTRKGV